MRKTEIMVQVLKAPEASNGEACALWMIDRKTVWSIFGELKNYAGRYHELRRAIQDGLVSVPLEGGWLTLTKKGVRQLAVHLGQAA